MITPAYLLKQMMTKMNTRAKTYKKIKLIRKIQKAYLFQLKDILKIKDAHKY